MSINVKEIQEQVQPIQALPKKTSMNAIEHTTLDEHISAGKNKQAIELLNQYVSVSDVAEAEKEVMRNTFMPFLPIAIEAAIKNSSDLSVIQKLLDIMDVQHDEDWQTRFFYASPKKIHYPLHYVFHVLENLNLQAQEARDAAKNKAKEIVTLLIKYGATTSNSELGLPDITNKIRNLFEVEHEKNDGLGNEILNAFQNSKDASSAIAFVQIFKDYVPTTMIFDVMGKDKDGKDRKFII